MRLITIEEWVEALRSGKFKQARMRLKSAEVSDSYCCLGVHAELCEVPSKKYDEFTQMIYYQFPEGEDSGINPLMKHYGMTEKGLPFKDMDNYSLTAFNDTGSSFNDIADTLESWLEQGLIHNPKEEDND